jgi:hypothetical protein
MHIIYDETRETNPCFLVTGLAWGGMLAVTAIALCQDFLRIPLEQRAVPEASAELWAAGWKTAGLGGGISLIFGLLGHGIATRVVVDGKGIKLSSIFGGDRWLFRWAEVRSWRVETYEEASYDSDGCGGIATLTRLVVELDSRAIPLVVKDTWKTAILAELERTIPLLRSQEHQRANPVAEG